MKTNWMGAVVAPLIAVSGTAPVHRHQTSVESRSDCPAGYICVSDSGQERDGRTIWLAQFVPGKDCYDLVAQPAKATQKPSVKFTAAANSTDKYIELGGNGNCESGSKGNPNEVLPPGGSRASWTHLKNPLEAGVFGRVVNQGPIGRLIEAPLPF